MLFNLEADLQQVIFIVVDPKTTYFTSIIPVYSPAIARTMLVGTQYISLIL